MGPDTGESSSSNAVPKPSSESELVPNPDNPVVPPSSDASSGSYGPLRRVRSKSGGPALFRPPQMHQDDAIDLLRDVVPQMVDASMEAQQGLKRPLETSSARNSSVEPTGQRPRVEGATDVSSEVLSVQETQQLTEQWLNQDNLEALVANHLQKKASKEIPANGNYPDTQALIDTSKRAEWSTILEKQAVRIHYGKRAEQIKQQHPDRFIGSRFVVTRKAVDEEIPIHLDDPATYKYKSRWRLQGHLHPDLDQKAQEGSLQSPTLSQIGRMLLMQLAASHKRKLELGDIKGAFMEAGPLPAKSRPLFASQPAGGIPGLPANAVIEVEGKIYGLNDAPCAWYRTFTTMKRPRLAGYGMYFLRDHQQRLCGVMGVHVGDTAVAGCGETYLRSVPQLKSRFPYRKWRAHEGEFCGAFYRQNPKTFAITMGQSQFADRLRYATIPKGSVTTTSCCPKPKRKCCEQSKEASTGLRHSPGLICRFKRVFCNNHSRTQQSDISEMPTTQSEEPNSTVI